MEERETNAIKEIALIMECSCETAVSCSISARQASSTPTWHTIPEHHASREKKAPNPLIFPQGILMWKTNASMVQWVEYWSQADIAHERRYVTVSYHAALHAVPSSSAHSGKAEHVQSKFPVAM